MDAVPSESWESEDFIRDHLDDWIELFDGVKLVGDAGIGLDKPTTSPEFQTRIKPILDSEANSDIASSKDKRASRFIEWEQTLEAF
ncbi:hypothetical protein K435DRAFT_879054 [Dendrothele bispora CBS 962.96]|uniref:Uncharacterized protein n=1 Tax=Dendrothele bispora (strain CBS 962.96) TaxID=1314807 RepID=A0A4S8KM31_DENBC|nr:hypothetical protein K435DRAFT_879054 [Dendrothele bispora CBS 962.96]